MLPTVGLAASDKMQTPTKFAVPVPAPIALHVKTVPTIAPTGAPQATQLVVPSAVIR